MSKAFLRLANGLVSLVVAVALITAGGYAAYCLWDDGQIYAAAEDVQAELLHLKPQVEPAEDGESGGPSFDELLAINPDVRAWVTMDNTKIDHPVLQGETNLDYINTDVYGDFALAGSIFLDARNAPDFTDPYSLLYGHHMANSGMFGDLDLYKDPEFFAGKPDWNAPSCPMGPARWRYSPACSSAPPRTGFLPHPRGIQA